MNVALASRDSEFLATGKSPVDESSVIVRINGEETNNARVQEAEANDLSNYLIFDGKSSSGGEASISFEYSGNHIHNSNSVQSSFDIGSKVTNPMADLQLMIMDSDNNIVADFGTLTELTGDSIQDASEPIYFDLDSRSRHKVQYAAIDYKTESSYNLGVNVTRLDSTKLNRFRVNLVVVDVDPESLSNSSKEDPLKIIDPSKLASGSYHWKITNTDANDNEIGIANITENGGFDDHSDNTHEVEEEKLLFSLKTSNCRVEKLIIHLANC